MCQSKPTDVPSTLLLDGINTANKYYHESLCDRGLDLTEYKKRGFDPRPYMIGGFAGIFLGLIVGRWLCNKVQKVDGPVVAPAIPLQTFGNAVYGATGSEGNASAEGQNQDDNNEERQSVLDDTSFFRASVGSRAEGPDEAEGSGRHSADAASVNQNPLGNPTATGYAANADMQKGITHASDDGLTMDIARGSRRTRHAASAASSQEVQAQAQAQLELEAATQRRRNRRQALQVQVTPDAAIAVAAAAEAGAEAGAHQTPEFGHRRREMGPPPNPFRLHRCEYFT
ncbi:hypothetical protein M440DRAFT_5325 [Trichoderma longibrachiatum ATCC 18648]|uniref:Uncharacterized protein n=1 Tax=Trichoderma longibrachiatum ATCC 18648 TaxID=983965 RepID=A0A2T4C2S8_TRILO|nr:hypothetical protein M440DRAFT_5325 [Trichoderma longibrachiatum ATCC 18648]